MVLETIFDEYAAWTDTVAVYPLEYEPQYLALGISDEWGELNQAVGDAYLKESGDVLWYIARYCTKVLKVSFQQAFEYSKAHAAAQWSILTHIGIISGVEKKRIRDGHKWNTETLYMKNRAAFDAIKNLLATISYLLNSRGYTIEQALAENMKKLDARKATNTIHGDGDNR